MNSQYKNNIEKLSQQLEENEHIEEIALFNTLPLLFMYAGICVALLISGRLFQIRYVMLLTSLLSMWMMAKAAQAFFLAQNSCVLVTNHRTFGYLGNREFSLPHTRVKRMVLNRVLFLDGGNAESSVVIKYASNRKKLYDKIVECGGKA